MVIDKNGFAQQEFAGESVAAANFNADRCQQLREQGREFQEILDNARPGSWVHDAFGSRPVPLEIHRW